jgi:hypothetical protein
MIAPKKFGVDGAIIQNSRIQEFRSQESISLKEPGLAGLALEGSRLRLPEASRTPPGALFMASSLLECLSA